MTLSAQITHFGIHATDLDHMVDFYTRVMGFVISDTGALLNPPRLHQTASGSPAIKAALTASAVHEHLNHYLILRLGVNATA